MNGIEDLFLHFLKDMYYAERQATKALPKMAKAAQNEQLRDMFKQSREEKPGHVELLQHVFEAVGKAPRGVTCEAMNGMIEEMQELLEEAKEPTPARDAALVASAQAIAHYGMARYGSLLAWAKVGKMGGAIEPLQQMLDACKSADQHLTKIANDVLNPKAAKAA